MEKILIIAEKQKVAKSIVSGSHRFKGSKLTQGSKPYYGYYENDQYIITWARGHLYEVMNPGEIDPIFKEFSFDNLPIIQPIKYKPVESSREQLEIITILINRNDVSKIVNACDKDKEGELIFREIFEGSATDKPMFRIWLSSYESSEVEVAFNRLFDGRDYDSLADSARARQYLDHLIGDTVTRASTVKLAKNSFLLSGGRVQLCLLNEIRNRELEIENFKPRKFYTLFSDTGFLAQYQTDEEYILNPEYLEKIGQNLKGQSLTVKDYKDKNSNRNTPNLFNATDFLKACIYQLSITAPQAKNILQKLYEEGYVSYPRTDSRHLPTSMIDAIQDVIHALPGHYKDIVGDIDLTKLSTKHKSFNDEKVSSHYAIIPTQKPMLESGSELELRVYDLIVKRFLSAWLDQATYNVREIALIDSDDNTFISREKVLVNPGFLKIYKDETEENEEIIFEEFSLPICEIGDRLDVKDFVLKGGTTKKSAYHTEASILTFMETAGRTLVEDEEIKELLKGKRIGTSATAETFIPKLLDRQYICEDKGKLKTTSLGATFIDSFPVVELKNPVFTAEMEGNIKRIEDKELSYQDFEDDINKFAHEIVNKMAAISDVSIAGIEKARNKDIVLFKCKCKKGSIVDKGKFYGCTNYPECTLRMPKSIKGKVIPPKQIEKLILEGETDLIKGFKDEEKGDFEAILVFTDGSLKMKKAIYGKCPTCKKGEIKKNVVGEKEFFGCSNFKEGCTFSISSTIKGKKLPDAQIKKLLQNRTTDFISGFIGKEQKEFTARITIKEDGGLQLIFPTLDDKTVGRCPLCKGRVVIGKNYYLCENYKKTCDFLLPPIYGHKKIPAKQIELILDKNISGIIKGFKNQDGTKTFDAKLSYDTEKKRLTYIFEK